MSFSFSQVKAPTQGSQTPNVTSSLFNNSSAESASVTNSLFNNSGSGPIPVTSLLNNSSGGSVPGTSSLFNNSSGGPVTGKSTLFNNSGRGPGTGTSCLFNNSSSGSVPGTSNLSNNSSGGPVPKADLMFNNSSGGLASQIGFGLCTPKESLPQERIPSKLRVAYKDIKLISTKDSRRSKISIFEGKCKITHELHIIKVLEPNQEDWKDDAMPTLFVQELLHLCSTQPKLVIINSFIMENNTLAYSLRCTTSLRAQFQAQKSSKPEEKSDTVNLEKVISGTVAELEILWDKRKIRGYGSAIQMDDIYYDYKNQKYWLGNWTNICQQSMVVTSYEDDLDHEPFTSQDISEELSALGMTIMELKEMNRPEIEKQRLNVELNENEYNLAVEKQLSKYFQKETGMRQIILSLVSRNKSNLPAINELKETLNLLEKAREGEETTGDDKLAHHKIEEVWIDNEEAAPITSLKKESGNYNRKLLQQIIN